MRERPLVVCKADGNREFLPVELGLSQRALGTAEQAAQARQFADDQTVLCGQSSEQLFDALLGRVLPRGGLHLDEPVDGEALLSRVIEHGHLLIGQVLGTCRNAQVGVIFGSPAFSMTMALSRTGLTAKSLKIEGTSCLPARLDHQEC